MEIKSLKGDINTTDYPNWFDKNKFKKMLATIDSNKFNTRTKQVNLSILTLKTWLIILKIIQLVKYMIKKI